MLQVQRATQVVTRAIVRRGRWNDSLCDFGLEIQTSKYLFLRSYVLLLDRICRFCGTSGQTRARAKKKERKKNTRQIGTRVERYDKSVASVVSPPSYPPVTVHARQGVQPDAIPDERMYIRDATENARGSVTNSSGTSRIPCVAVCSGSREACARIGKLSRRFSCCETRLPILHGNLSRNTTVGNASVARSQTGFAAGGQALWLAGWPGDV